MRGRQAAKGQVGAPKRTLLAEVFLEMALLALMEFLLIVLVMSMVVARQSQRAQFVRGEQLARVLAARLSAGLSSEEDLRRVSLLLGEQLSQMGPEADVQVVIYVPGHALVGLFGQVVEDDEISDLLRRAHLSGNAISPSPQGIQGALGAGWAWTAVPIGGGADSRPRGAVAVAVQRPPFWNWLRGQWLLAGYAVALLLTLLGLGAYRVYTLVVRPLDQLVRASHQVTAGSREFQGSDPRARELATLEGHLKEMTAQLLSREQDLQKQLTELEETRDELLESEKLATVGRLASGIAHEVGNPLSAVAGYLELLADAKTDAEQRADLIGRSVQELARADRILRGLLDFARPQPFRPQRVDLANLAHRVAEMVKAQKIFYNIEIIEDTQEPVWAWADPGLTEQVLVNLLINGADAMEGRGELRLSVASGPAPKARRTESEERAPRAGRLIPGEPAAVVVVQDGGPGVPAADAAKLFEPFFTTKPPGAGTGLGLAVSAQVAARQGGLLRLARRDGPQPGQGACFELWLPLQEGTHRGGESSGA